MAKWRDKSWEVSPQKVTAVENLAFAYEQKADNNNSAEGSPSTNERGTELFSLSFTCTLHANAGADVRTEIENWQGLVSKTGPFYLNEKQLGPNLQLCKVSAANITLDDFGRMRLATLTFTLKEYNAQTTSVSENGTLYIGADKSDKESKKPGNSQAGSSSKIGIKVGSSVKPTGQRYTNGLTIPDWVKQRIFKIVQINGIEAVIKTDGVQNTVFLNELTLI